ncbi:hypothetical protein BUALT_Bualt16G0080200 [Buddleja alternifolia]|uniref:Uncharacterized protein n=1 Tax=Buddleja alternifolia TaxID=168488 RepID=A0AAV6WBI2_9LAMI|nr:hypothetical protein BUALT_Bualt16G0080200 [Buddleja alternifolia]
MDYTNLSLKHKLKQSLCFSCCFPRRYHSPPLSASDDNPPLIWVKPHHHDHSLSEIKEKCRSMLGISATKHHKRHSSTTDFRYDPLSYALNFEDAFEFDDEAPLKNFSARLPPSPPVTAAVS